MNQIELTATILAGICASPVRALSGHAQDNVALAIEYADELRRQFKEHSEEGCLSTAELEQRVATLESKVEEMFPTLS